MNWTVVDIPIENEEKFAQEEIDVKDLHLNSIVINQHQNDIAIAAESGYVYISNNVAKNWEVVKSPYKGSFFGGEFIDESSILFYGLRGNIYLFNKVTNEWKKIESGTNESLHSSFIDEDAIYIVGYGATILKVDRNTLKATKLSNSSKQNYTSFIKFKNNYYISSDHGIEIYK